MIREGVASARRVPLFYGGEGGFVIGPEVFLEFLRVFVTG